MTIEELEKPEEATSDQIREATERATEAADDLARVLAEPATSKTEALLLEELRNASARYKADKEAEVAFRKIEADERVARLQTTIEQLRADNSTAIAKGKTESDRKIARWQYLALVAVPVVGVLGGFLGNLRSEGKTGNAAAATVPPPATATGLTSAASNSSTPTAAPPTPCDGFAGTWKRPKDDEVLFIAATTDCRLVYTANTPQYEQYMTTVPRHDGTVDGKLLRRTIANGCSVYLNVHLTRVGKDEIQEHVTSVSTAAGTKGFCDLPANYTERFTLTRVK